MKKSNNTFFDTFVGEFVEIVQDFEVTTNIHLNEDGHPVEMRMPMTVNGFIMDSDGEFVYLSQNGEEINQALPINSIKHVGIVDVANQVEETFNDFPDPEDKSGYN